MGEPQQQLLNTVIEAASALVGPQTDPRIRTEASKYLEDLSGSPSTWPIFAQWTRAEQPIEVRLLNLQLLQSKIRKQVPYQNANEQPPYLDEIRNVLEGIAVAAIVASDTSHHAATPACICLAAVLIRTNALSQLVESLIAARTPVSHLILSHIPMELQSVSDLTTTAVATELQNCCHAILAYVQESAAVDVLLNWVNVARITVSQIAHFPALLDGLLTLLRSHEPTKASQILQEALGVPSDHGTSTRMAACQKIRDSIPTWNFRMEDRGKLLATFTTEEINTLITQPSEELLSALLKLQRCSEIHVRGAILECWLAVSDKPLKERHENWGKPLFQQVTLALLETVCLDEDEDDRAEYQRLCGDVLVDCYCLLRSDFLAVVVSSATTSNQMVIPSLVCLNAAAREINSRAKSRLVNDGGQVADYVSQMIPLLGLNVESAQFVGAFSPTWAIKCQKEDLLQMLASLMRLVSNSEEHVSLEASKSIKQLLIHTSNSLKQGDSVLQHLQTLIRAALTTQNEQALANVTEGCIRTGHDTVEIVKPIVQMAEIWLEATTDPFAIDHLACCLNALIVALRFSELSSHRCYEFLAPFLKKVSAAYLTIDSILEKLLGIERQLLVLAPAEALTHFQATISFVQDAFAARHQPVCLNFFASAVESIPETNHDAFREPITRLSISFVEMLQKHGPIERSATIEAFYEMIQRCMLFCPVALAASDQYPHIMACAVDCLEACKGERQSTRAILNFLTKTFGWKALPVRETLQRCSLDQELSKHGARVSALCIGILMGGTQALLPPCADCIYAIVAGSDPRVAHTWLSMPCRTFDQKVVDFVVHQLFSLATGERTAANKSKANMLLRDFAMIQLGELSPDALVSYALQ